MALKQIYAIGFIVRFLPSLVLPNLSKTLASMVVLSTPMNSAFALQEAFFYIDNGVNPYDGGVNHHPPLLVAFFGVFHINFPRFYPYIVSFLYAILDILIASRIIALNRWYQQHREAQTGKKTSKLSDALVGSFYLFNPLILLSTLSQSSLLLSLVFITEAVHQLVNNKNLPRSMISLAVATYLSVSPVLLIVPLLALAHVLLKVELAVVYFQGPALFVSSCALLFLFSFVITSSMAFFDQCYGALVRFDKLSPNIGLWWYLFTEMFDFFTVFYIGTFNLFTAMFIVPITIRLFESPGVETKIVGDSFLAFFLCYIWVSFTKGYPTLGDLGFGISLLPIFSGTILPHCTLVGITALTLLVALILSPIFYYCWIVLGTGNSNFFYSTNLIFGAVHILVLVDLFWTQLVIDYSNENKIPEKERSDLRLTQI